MAESSGTQLALMAGVVAVGAALVVHARAVLADAANPPSSGVVARTPSGPAVGSSTALKYARASVLPPEIAQQSPVGAGAAAASTAFSPRSAGVAADGGSAVASPAPETAAAAAAGTGLKDPWASGDGDKPFSFEGSVVRRLSPSMAIQDVLLLEVPSLRVLLPDQDAALYNTRLVSGLRAHAASADDWPVAHPAFEATAAAAVGGGGHDAEPSTPSSEYFSVVRDEDEAVILGDIVRNRKLKAAARAFVRAGPRAVLYFHPRAVKAAIVTCGGLCPGLNNVIRDVVLTLQGTYGVETIHGVQHGYWGFHTPDADPVGSRTGSKPSPNAPAVDPPLLTMASVAGIHDHGGTVLGSDRGGHDSEVILRFCANRGVNQLYILGGDGTHRGANAVAEAAKAAGLPLAVVGIPKTIDNDIALIDRSFGFDTAVGEAVRAIKCAKVEAAGALNGVGIVKLMGRYAGYIAGHATLASGDVDLCLIPEVPIVLDGPASCLEHVAATIRAKGHAVIVVAEGAGEDILDAEIVASGGKVEKDAGGNRKLPPVGPWLQRRVAEYLTAAGLKPNIKYIDPSYTIRSTPANPSDALFCTLLSQAAVHGAMAGFTGFSVGLVNNRVVYLPINAITANSPRRMNPRGRTYERILQITRQPDPLAH